MPKIPLLIFLFISNLAIGQVDTIAFTLDKKLLVFKGKINGEVIDFAFDTGASSGVANSINVSDAKLTVLDSKNKVSDANQNKHKISYVKVKDLELGSFHFKNLKDVHVDMQMLKCNNLYLLGQNVIKKLNWKIDFEKKLLFISKKGFVSETKYKVWNIKKYENNRPIVEFLVEDKQYKLLVDFGFTGIFEVNSKVETIKKQFDVKQKKGTTESYMTTNMGLFGLGAPKLNQDFILDSLTIGDEIITNIPTTIEETTDTKIGVGFFSSFCKTVILNFHENKIYILQNSYPIKTRKPYDIKVNLENGVFKVYSKNLNPNSPAAEFEIGEQVSSIDGKKPSDFYSECDFFNWFFFKNEEIILIEKKDGKVIEIGRSSL